MVEYTNSDLFLEDSVDKQTTISFDGGVLTNSDLYSQEMTLEESLCSETTLRFGACESSVLKFKIGELATSLKGKRITVSQVLANQIDTPFVYGQFTVVSDKKRANFYGREIVAYDDMYTIVNADVSAWYNGLSFPISLKNFRNSFFNHFGIEQENVSLVNDNMTVQKTVQPTVLSGKTVINAICELNGCFGHIGRDGKFQYKFLSAITKALYPSETLYPSEHLFPASDNVDAKITTNLYQSLYVEEYNVQKITKLQIRQESNDIGAIYGNGDNCYIVQDNFLVYGKSASELQTIAQNLYGVISFVEYTPYEIVAKGNPCTEVGDLVKIYTKDGAISTYVLNRTLSGIQSLTDTLRADGDEYQAEEVNSLNDQIIQLKGKTTEIKVNVDGVSSRVSNIENGSASVIQQLSNSISAKVSQTGGSASSFGWSLTANGFVLQSGNQNVFVCNSGGITVNGYATAQSVSAVDGKINTLSAKAITTDNFSAQNINANKITAGTLSVERLSSSVLTTDNVESQITSKSLTVNALTANSAIIAKGGIFYGAQQRFLSCSELTINSTKYKIVTWSD